MSLYTESLAKRWTWPYILFRLLCIFFTIAAKPQWMGNWCSLHGISGCCKNNHRYLASINVENRLMSAVTGEIPCLVPGGTNCPYPSPPRCFLVNIAYFLTWTTEWRGQPGGDPHLQLWLLPQQSPDITNHTPAGGETESVWQLLAKGAGEEKMGEDKIQTDKQQKKKGGGGEKQLFQFEEDEKSTMSSSVCSEVLVLICSPFHKTI